VFINDDLILKETVKLYNNIAQIDNCQGRLSAELRVYPTPQIIWDFEMLGNTQCNFPSSSRSDLSNPLVGHLFSIDEAHWRTLLPQRALNGLAQRAIYGDLESPAHEFIFYIPNFRVQEKVHFQNYLEATVTESETNRKVASRNEGKYIDIDLDDIWKIRLQTHREALDWLKNNKENIGTLITTFGRLYQSHSESEEAEIFSEIQTTTLSSVSQRLGSLGLMLSYANGGYTYPLYIESRYYNNNDLSFRIQNPSAIVQVSYPTTPLEQLSSSWVGLTSNLEAYVRCLPTFERMRQNNYWEDTIHFTFAQYFQATQLVLWPVAASAAGAALERLSYIILVEEETHSAKKANHQLLFDTGSASQAKARRHWNLGKNPGQEDITLTGKRLRLLLDRIGLTKVRGYNDIDDVPFFLSVRNDAVHPRTSSMTIEQRWRYIYQAIQWIDEVLLWRLGYNGGYLDRMQGGNLETPRYDLSIRSSAW
jgi:hypothetical protein